MRKIIFLTILTVFISNCSSDESKVVDSTFSISLVPSLTSVVIDQAFTVAVTGNESISAMWVSTDNFATGGYALRNFSSSYTLNFNFDTLGQKTISVRAKNQNNIVSEKQIIVNVTRGNAIKINGLQVVSFYGINTPYDPEFPITNPNHLADLRFGLSKIKLGNPLDNIYSPVFWYLSSVIENQGTMTWDCSNSNLYINPNASLKFGLADMDNGIAGADLLNGPPDFREINFSNYLITKPTTITYSFPEINLEFKVFVEW
jgi:hypothetical protein